MTENSKKPQITAQQLSEMMRTGQKITGAQILSDLLNNNGNLHMKGSVNSPMSYSTMGVKARFLSRNKLRRASLVFKDITDLDEQYNVAKRGKDNRANRVIKATEFVMQQEHDITKAKARSLVGQ